jgi:type II secretory pathway pseudopilin PulG
MSDSSKERGGALIALLALMTIMSLVMLAAAPNLWQNAQRARELAAIRRGDEIADAIRIFAQYNQRLPKTMDELLEGVNVPGKTKKLMILRESAARDPLSSNGADYDSSSGGWKLIQSNDKVLLDFQRQVMKYNDGVTPATPNIPALQAPLAVIVNSINTETSEETDPPEGEDDSQNIDAPFVGVASRSRAKSIVTFYDIGRHDQWIFTPIFRGSGATGMNRPNMGGPPNLPNVPQPQPSR